MLKNIGLIARTINTSTFKGVTEGAVFHKFSDLFNFNTSKKSSYTDMQKYQYRCCLKLLLVPNEIQWNAETNIIMAFIEQLDVWKGTIVHTD